MLLSILWMCCFLAFGGIAVQQIGSLRCRRCRRALDRMRVQPSHSRPDLDRLAADMRLAARLRTIGGFTALAAVTVGGPVVEYSSWAQGFMSDELFILALSLHIVGCVIAVWVYRKTGQ